MITSLEMPYLGSCKNFKLIFGDLVWIAFKTEMVTHSLSPFSHTMGNRVLWTWDSETNVTVTKLDADDPRINYFSQTRVHTCNLVSFINYMIRQRPSVTPPKTTLYIGAQKSTKQDGAETPTSSGLKNM